MAKTLVFPATHPGGAVIAAGDKLIFEVTTNSVVPIFSFKVDAILTHDASTAPHTIVGKWNRYRWEHPATVPKPGEVNATDIAVIVIDNETYDLKVSLKKPRARATLLVHVRFAGPETLLRDTFGVVVA